MRMIISAYTQGALNTTNARQTGNLLTHLSYSAHLQYELAVGVFKNEREISVIVSGFRDSDHMLNTANELGLKFKQQGVYVEFAGAAYLLTPDIDFDARALSLAHAILGFPLDIPNAAGLRAVFPTEPNSYTLRLNGTVIAVAPVISATKEKHSHENDA